MATTVKNFRLDETTRSWLKDLADGSTESEVLRDLIREAHMRKRYARLQVEAERMAADPADLAEVKAVQEEMSEIRAW